MRNYLIIFIFLTGCSFNEFNKGVVNNKIIQSKINLSSEYSFEEYVNLLLNVNSSKNYPDINSFPD